MDTYLEDTQAGTPYIEFNADTGVFIISGKSLPENADEFYEPALEWFRQYKSKPNALTKIVFRLDYFDTASSKKMLDLLFILKDIAGNVMIEWHYFEDDDDMKEVGYDFEEILEMNFKMVEEVFTE